MIGGSHPELVDPETGEAVPLRDRTLDMQRYLIAFKDGSYKKVTAVEWKHSQWIHFTLPNKTIVRVNPDNVNYIHQGVWD